MKSSITIVLLIFVFCFPLFGQNESTINLLVGNWYMGTMSGSDCFLKIYSDGKITVQYGGCFQQDPIIKAKWKLDANKIVLMSDTLKSLLGSHLNIEVYKGNIILVPEHEQSYIAHHGFQHSHCFWKNLMKNGLELPKEASDFEKHK
jgi:hypothetical protein